MDTSTLPQLDETRSATTRYLEALTVLDDAAAREPSLLPGWTRAHVVAHLSRNADALARVLDQAAAGEPASMYDAQAARDHDIEDTVTRLDADRLRADARSSADRLERAWRTCDAPADTPYRRVPGDSDTFPLTTVGFRRRVEVEIHHADLDLGYSPADWPTDFAVRMVDQRRDDLAAARSSPSMLLTASDTGHVWRIGSGEAAVEGTVGDLAWWLVGRGARRLICTSGALPVLGPW